MTEKIFLEQLDKCKVNILKRQYITVNDTEYAINEPFRCSYVNSNSCRVSLKNDIPEPYYSAIMLVWGDTPTVTDKEIN